MMKTGRTFDFVIRLVTHRYAFHLYYWLFIFYRNYLLVGARNSDQVALAYGLSVVAVGVVPVYLHLFALRLVYARKLPLYLVALAGAALLGAAIDNAVFAGLFSQRLGFLQSLYDTAGLLVITTALHFLQTGIGQRFLLQETRAKQVESELAALRSRLNPHFLFNTMNSLYALALSGSDKTAETVLKISDMMRYMLDKAVRDRVPLDEEIGFIRGYMELERLRIPRCEASFVVAGDPGSVAIAPMMLMPIVENAFKHGTDPSGPSCDAEFRLEIADGRVAFSSANAAFPRAGGHGVGIANLRRRLELTYPGKHRLEIADSGPRHAVTLEIST